jgi:hypothetical protein
VRLNAAINLRPHHSSGLNTDLTIKSNHADAASPSHA